MDESLYEKVKNYFSGNLSNEERARFESEIVTNKELKEIFDLYQIVDDGIFDAGESADEESSFRNSLRKIHEQFIATEISADDEHIGKNDEKGHLSAVVPEKETTVTEPVKAVVTTPQNGKIRRIKLWKRLAIAAIATGIVVTTATWYFQREKTVTLAGNDKINKAKETANEDTSRSPAGSQTDSTTANDRQEAREQKKDEAKPNKSPAPNNEKLEALYASNFEPNTIPSDFSDLLQEALSHFKEEDYKYAIAAIDVNAIKTSLEELRPKGLQNEQQEKEEMVTIFYAYYYRALSQMAENDSEKAIPELQHAVKNAPDKFLQGKARWYLALACIKTGKNTDALKYLNQLAQAKESGRYKQKALKLIDNLEEEGNK